jgi:hypothetical protein
MRPQNAEAIAQWLSVPYRRFARPGMPSLCCPLNRMRPQNAEQLPTVLKLR